MLERVAMRGGIALLALASNASTAPAIHRKEENIVIVGKEHSASIEQATEDVLSRLLVETVTTYQFGLSSIDSETAPFVSPVTNSFTIKARLRVGGKIVQPPIDFDDIVYFDE